MEIDMAKRNDSKVDFSIDKTSRLGILKVMGALTVQRVSELRQAVEACQGQVNCFRINLEKVTAVDLSSIGLLYSTCQTMTRSNQPLAVEGICPVIFTSAVENMGYSYHRWLCFGQ